MLADLSSGSGSEFRQPGFRENLANLTKPANLTAMEQYTSEDARREWRRILDKIQRGESVEITRYGERLAVVVPAEWFDQLSEQERAFRSMGRTLKALEEGNQP